MKLATQRRALLGAALLGVALGLRTLAPAQAASQSAAADAAAPPKWTPTAAETDSPASRLLDELRRRNEELDARERDLATRERSLEELAAEAKNTLGELDLRRAQLEQRIEALAALQGDGVMRLARVYAAMPPARAAELLAQLDVEVASVVLARMKPKVSAGVLAAMGSDQALRLTVRAALPFDETPAPSEGEGRFR